MYVGSAVWISPDASEKGPPTCPSRVSLITHSRVGAPAGPPDELVFVSSFTGGEVFRSGCCWRRGKGRVFYFAPGHETYPVYLLLAAQDPPPGALPEPVPPTETDDGPHLVYAVQWFLFTTIALVGYGAILRREARKQPVATAPANGFSAARLACSASASLRPRHSGVSPSDSRRSTPRCT